VPKALCKSSYSIVMLSWEQSCMQKRAIAINPQTCAVCLFRLLAWCSA